MNRREFALQLITEMAHFILDSDPMRLVISLHQESDGLHLAVIDSVKRSPSELEAIRRALNSEQRPELAGYYGSMVGYDSLGAARLNLVGWQLKGADVRSTNSGTHIDLWLGGDRFNPERFSITAEQRKTSDE